MRAETKVRRDCIIIIIARRFWPLDGAPIGPVMNNKLSAGHLVMVLSLTEVLSWQRRAFLEPEGKAR